MNYSHQDGFLLFLKFISQAVHKDYVNPTNSNDEFLLNASRQAISLRLRDANEINLYIMQTIFGQSTLTEQPIANLPNLVQAYRFRVYNANPNLEDQSKQYSIDAIGLSLENYNPGNIYAVHVFNSIKNEYIYNQILDSNTDPLLNNYNFTVSDNYEIISQSKLKRNTLFITSALGGVTGA